MAVVCDIVRDQIQRGWEVFVACPAKGALAAQIREIGATHLLWEASRNPGLTVFREIKSLQRCIRQIQPDVVHLHSSKAGLAGRLALRGQIPTLFQPHAWSFLAVSGLTGKAALLWEKFSHRWADAVICVSESERQLGIESGIRAPWKIARNGISLDRWQKPCSNDRRLARDRLGIPQQSNVTVCVGRICRQKGQDLLITAWPAVREKIPDARLYLIGDGPDLENLRKCSHDDINFTGPRSDVRDWYLAADIVAMPSRWEGLSIAMLEAMATERPVVAADVTGMRETLADGTGILVAVQSIENLTEAIIRLLSDQLLSKQLGKNARLRVETHFDVRLTCDQIAAITQLAVNRRTDIKGQS